MTFDALGLDGNVLEIVLLATAFTLIVAIFFVGRLSGMKERGSEKCSIDALRQVRAEEEARFDTLLRDARRAEDTLERWETVKRDHERLDEMRRELDEFEREESRRIDELERHRAEAARRLGELRAALDMYPPEITGNQSSWDELIANRKEAFDQMRLDLEGAEKELAEVDARRARAADEAGSFEARKSRLDDEIKAAQELLDRIENGQIDTLKPHNERLIDEVSHLQSHIAILGKSKKDPDAARGVKPGPDIEKLSAFRMMPDCLEGYDDALAKPDEYDLLSGFEESLRSRRLQYPRRIIRAFHTALKVNDLSPLTVLSGLSGTGKSQLPRAYARYFGIHFLHVPVEPGWDSPQDMLGFYDFVAERYRPTDRARALGHFDSRFAAEIGIEDDPKWNERMLIILLDEMNLARTEYYFSEFLSRLELRGPRTNAGQDDDSRDDAQIAIDLPYAEGERPKHLYVPHNVLWVGTLNEDETTQALSDKVLDRANSIRFAPPDPSTLREHSSAPDSSVKAADGYLPYRRWLEWSNHEATDKTGAELIDETLEDLATLMQKARRGFGYRIAQSIKAYISRYPGQDWRVPMIDQINMRLLPKLSGAEMNDCQEMVDELRRLCSETLGDPVFAQKLQEAETASEPSQIFTWPGYAYEE